MEHTDDSSFYKQVVENKGLTLVKFWADWCQPCRLLTPKLNKLSGEYADELTVFTLDIEANPNTAELYQIKSIPTLLLFKSGMVIGRLVGNADTDDIQDFIDKGISHEEESKTTDQTTAAAKE